MIGWHDMSNAPRDGTYFRGRDDTGRIFLCRWYSREEIAEWNGSDTPEEWDPGFYENDDDDEGVEPSLWQPVEGEGGD
jgi:hypothetical protein